MPTNENQRLPEPDQPDIIEVSNYDYPAKLAELRSLGVHIEQIKVLDSGYRLTVEWTNRVSGVTGA